MWLHNHDGHPDILEVGPNSRRQPHQPPLPGAGPRRQIKRPGNPSRRTGGPGPYPTLLENKVQLFEPAL